jgi:hypothetical protein
MCVAFAPSRSLAGLAERRGPFLELTAQTRSLRLFLSVIGQDFEFVA